MSKYLFVADIHSRYDIPVCRIDDFRATQRRKYKWLAKMKKKYNATILHSGDLTHKARPDNGNELLNEILYPTLPIMEGIAGNHDLLYHKMENLYKSLLGVICNSGKYHLYENGKVYGDSGDALIYPFNFGTEIETPEYGGVNSTIAIYHGYVSQKSGFIAGEIARSLLKKFPDFNVILTGDNHDTFVEEYEGRILINPGSFTRQSADKIKHKPCVFLYDSITHEYEQLFVPIEEDVFNLDHLEIQKEKDDRLNSFVDTVNSDYEIGGSFKKNIDTYLLKNETPQDVIDIIYECMEG